MIPSSLGVDPTRTVGIVSYVTAFTCCAVTSFRMRTRLRIARLATTSMMLETALVVDMIFNLRWKLHDVLMNFAMREHEYGQRSLPQLVTVTLLGCLLLAGFAVSRRSLRGRGTTLLAVWGAMLSIAMWCVEVVSLHALDHVLYSPLLGIRAVSFVWILASALTSIGILLDPR